MSIAQKIDAYISQSSWIRKMFEAGTELKKQYGEDNVFDFSIGNPNLEPPEALGKAIIAIATSELPNKHGYMPNAGYLETRTVLAEQLSSLYKTAIEARHIIMTCGAGGALNVIFKTLLDPGDEVIIITPFFVEYKFYIDNFGGTVRIAKSNEDFSLSIPNIAAAINDKTKALLINSPNNPSGRVYDGQALAGLAALLKEQSALRKKPIYLISDEPYREIVYEGMVLPSVLWAYPHSIIAYSYSKSISVPGERIGYILVSPAVAEAEKLIDGLILSNRILGFVNAPALMQRVIAMIGEARVDVHRYEHKRDLLCALLAESGYEFIKPEGAFYLFPKSPLADDVAFVRILQSKRVLGVPGSGFGAPGYFRLAYCVTDATIINSAASFAEAIAECRSSF